MSTGNVENAITDVDGFLLEGSTWDEEIAYGLAQENGIEALSEDHWKVIQALRNEFIAGKPDLFPRVPEVCRHIGIAEERIDELFGDALVAWQVAGLPKPDIDLEAFMPESHLVGKKRNTKASH